MKTWLKYGLWFSGVYLAIGLILFPFDELGLITAVISPGLWIYGILTSILGHGFTMGSRAIKTYVLFLGGSIISWFVIGSVIGLIISNLNSTVKKIFGWIFITGGLGAIVSEFFLCKYACADNICRAKTWEPGCMIFLIILGLILLCFGVFIIWKQRK
jgi:hypothetical protein